MPALLVLHVPGNCPFCAAPQRGAGGGRWTSLCLFHDSFVLDVLWARGEDKGASLLKSLGHARGLPLASVLVTRWGVAGTFPSFVVCAMTVL